ncbi:MAG: efflux transporter outer membrane subunit [Acidobacteriaceae bacterium]
MRPRYYLALACLSLSGCAVGPNYHRPKVQLPPAYRGEAPALPATASVQSLGNEEWWKVFHDPVLEQLIHTALQQNYDVRIAAARVLQAHAQVGIIHSNEFPSVSAGANIFSSHIPKIRKALPAYSTHAGEIDLSILWNLDFWGKYRRETEAARANLLSTEWGRRAVIDSVVSSVATAYFQLRELDRELEISQSTLASRKYSLRLTQVLTDNGSASLLDLRQAQELVYTASETIPILQKQIQQQENLIRILLGKDPGSVARGFKLTAQPLPVSLPVGLPSELLERRPDIRVAEANLIAANAEIGVAKAALFPAITLTGVGGSESNALNQFLTGPSLLWDTAGSATQTIFQAGALRAGLQLTRAQKQQMLLVYEQAIQEALREVSDSLVAYQKDQEFLKQQQLLTAAAKDANRLSNILYQHGGASYLQVLTSETNYFAAQLNLVQAQLDQQLALVQLYNALGGGWQP